MSDRSADGGGGSLRSTFAITSAVLGEGKTTTTLNLAVVMAQAGSQVCVVDADLRRPASHVHVKGTLSPGLSDILRGNADWREMAFDAAGDAANRRKDDDNGTILFHHPAEQ